jgi:hypothetical protein
MVVTYIWDCDSRRLLINDHPPLFETDQMSRSEEKLIFSQDDGGYFHYSVPSSVPVLSRGSFQDLRSRQLLASVTFQSPSSLLRLERSAFYWCILLKCISIPCSVEILCELCLCSCFRLESVTFESGSKLSRIEKLAFSNC